MELILLLLVGGGIWWWLRSRSAAQQRAAAQGTMDARAIELLVEFPDLSDADIATLLRDELINSRRAHPALMAWATEETVGRLRRTLLVTYARQRSVVQEAPPPAPALPQGALPTGANSFVNEHGVVVTRLKACPKCGTKLRGDAVRCLSCSEFFPSA